MDNNADTNAVTIVADANADAVASAVKKTNTDAVAVPDARADAVNAGLQHDRLNQFSPIPRPWTHSPSPSPLSQRRQFSTPASVSRPSNKRRLFSSELEASLETSCHMNYLLRDCDLSNQAKVFGYLQKIDQQQKQCIALHYITIDKLDALITVLTSHAVPVPSTAEPSAPVQDPEELPDQYSPSAEVPEIPDRDAEAITDHVFYLRSKASSEKNFAVQLLRYIFKPQELEGRNVRGVQGKLPLDSVKLDKIQELLFKYYPTTLTSRDNMWRDCRKAIDTYIRSKKFQAAHRVE